MKTVINDDVLDAVLVPILIMEAAKVMAVVGMTDDGCRIATYIDELNELAFVKKENKEGDWKRAGVFVRKRGWFGDKWEFHPRQDIDINDTLASTLLAAAWNSTHGRHFKTKE